MPLFTRFTNIFRRRRLDDELAEELASHLEEALEHGRSAAEARKAFGSALHHREQSRHLKLLPWLDSLVSDVVFGWRQLRKRPAVSAAAVLSLALAIGAATAAYRHAIYDDTFDYPTFRRYREITADRADLMVVGMTGRPNNAIFGAASEVEKIYSQYVSGNVFPVFGLRSALGRLLAPTGRRAGVRGAWCCSACRSEPPVAWPAPVSSKACSFEVKPGDPGTVAAPLLILVAAALLAALPPAIRAAKIDPAQTLRSE